MKSQTTKAAATWGFQVCFFFSALEIKKQGRKDQLSLPAAPGGSAVVARITSSLCNELKDEKIWW